MKRLGCLVLVGIGAAVVAQIVREALPWDPEIMPEPEYSDEELGW